MYLTIEHGDFPAIAVETGHIPVRIQSLMTRTYFFTNRCAEKKEESTGDTTTGRW